MGIENRQVHEPGTGRVGPSWWGLPDTVWDRCATNCVSPDGTPVDSPRTLTNQGDRLSGMPRHAISPGRQRDVAHRSDGTPVNAPEQTLIDAFDATTVEVLHHPNGHAPPFTDENERTDIAELFEDADPIDYEYQPAAPPPGDEDER
jgi:hypothetical protein